MILIDLAADDHFAFPAQPFAAARRVKDYPAFDRGSQQVGAAGNFRGPHLRQYKFYRKFFQLFPVP